MNNPKCAHCGLVNFTAEAECRRCGAALGAQATAHAAEEIYVAPCELEDERPARGRSIVKRALAVCAVTLVLLLVFYVSLLETAEPLSLEQREAVERAVARIEQGGLARDAFVLRRLTSYRATDNWWNRWLGHQEAYASTNFPFEVVTLYKDFFEIPKDDTERAALLLHEARHLRGADEEEALRGVWKDKSKLGWTEERYGATRAWSNVSELTRRYVPALFDCGPEGKSDCTAEQASVVGGQLKTVSD